MAKKSKKPAPKAAKKLTKLDLLQPVLFLSETNDNMGYAPATKRRMFDKIEDARTTIETFVGEKTYNIGILRAFSKDGKEIFPAQKYGPAQKTTFEWKATAEGL